MNKSPTATDFGNCPCEDSNAISDETDRPCIDPSMWEGSDDDASSAKKEVKSDVCP